MQEKHSGVIADIANLQNPQSVQPVIKRMRQYIDAMAHAQKPVTRIDMYASHYDACMRSLNASATVHGLPPIIGLQFGAIPVTRRIDG